MIKDSMSRTQKSKKLLSPKAGARKRKRQVSS